jgi:hypothetical protein
LIAKNELASKLASKQMEQASKTPSKHNGKQPKQSTITKLSPSNRAMVQASQRASMQQATKAIK